MKLPPVDVATLHDAFALDEAWRRWHGSIALSEGETALAPKLQLVAGAPVDAATFLAEHGAVGPVQAIGCHFLNDITYAGVLYPFFGQDLIDDGSHLAMVSADWLTRFPAHRPGGKTNASIRTIHDPVIHVAGPGHRTYGHWIIDFLPRLAIARQLLGEKFDNLKFLVLSDTPPWGFDLLQQFLNIPKHACILFNAAEDEFLCHRVCYPTYAHSYPFMLHSFIPAFYQSLCDDPPGERRFCVVNSSSSDNRLFHQRAAFEQMAVREGFELLDPHRMSIRQQAALFRSANTIIGEYGSALHNSVFCSSDAVIGVLNAPGVEQTRLCAAFQQRIVYMPSNERSGPWSLSENQLSSFFEAIRNTGGCANPRPSPPATPVAKRLGSDFIFIPTTMYGTVLAADIRKRELVHSEEITAHCPPVVVYLPPGVNLAFMIYDNPGLQPFAPRYQRLNGPVIVTRYRRMPEGTITFCHPHERTFLLAHNEISLDRTGMVAFHGRDAGEWKHFSIAPIDRDELPVALCYQLELIDRVVNVPPSQRTASLRSAPFIERTVMAQLLAGIMTPDDAEVLADQVLNNTSKLTDLVELLPDDPWAQHALPALRECQKKRRATASLLPSARVSASATSSTPKAKTAIGVDFDRLAFDGTRGEFASIAHYCAVMARQAIPPVKDLCVLTSARDEGLYIVDWLAYHRCIGVDHFIVYTNGNADGSDRLLTVLAQAGEITLIENHVTVGVAPQYKVYGHALSVAPELLDYRWCANIDLDEAIGFDAQQFVSLKGFIGWHELQPVDAISLNWIIFSSSRAMRWHDQPLMLRFQDRLYCETHVKTIFRPRMFHHASPHIPIASGLYERTHRDAAGQNHPAGAAHSAVAQDAPAWIAHYFYRSFEEFVWKFSRGRGGDPFAPILPAVNVPQDFMAGFVRQHTELPLIRDERILACAPDLATEIYRLKSLPGVNEALESIFANYRRRSTELAGLIKQARATASTTERAFYDLLVD